MDASKAVQDYQTLREMSELLAQSQCFYELLKEGQKRYLTTGEIFVRVLAGQELGLPPVYSVGQLYVQGGRVCSSAKCMWSMIKGSGLLESSQFEETSTSCRLTVKRKGNPRPYSLLYTMDDAIKAGLATRSVWIKYPGAMMRSRVISAVANVEFGDVTGNMHTREELGYEWSDDVAAETVSARDTIPPEVPVVENVLPPTPAIPEPITPTPDPPKPPSQSWTEILNAIRETEARKSGTVGNNWTDEQHAELLIAFASDKMKSAWATQLLEKLAKAPTSETAALGISFFRTRGILPAVQEPVDLPQEVATAYPGMIENTKTQNNAQEVTEPKSDNTEAVAVPELAQG